MWPTWQSFLEQGVQDTDVSVLCLRGCSFWSAGTVQISPCHHCLNGWMLTCWPEVYWLVKLTGKALFDCRPFNIMLQPNCCILFSLSLHPTPFPCSCFPSLLAHYPLTNGAADELGIEFMGKITSSWLSLIAALNPSRPLSSAKQHMQKACNPAQQGHPPLKKLMQRQSPWKHCGGELGVFCLHKEEYCSRSDMGKRAITTDSLCGNVCLLTRHMCVWLVQAVGYTLWAVEKWRFACLLSSNCFTLMWYSSLKTYTNQKPTSGIRRN